MFKKILYIAILCIFLHQTTFAFSLLSCNTSSSFFKGYLCQNSYPYQTTTNSITYLVTKDGKTFQMKIKPMTEQEIESYNKTQMQKPEVPNSKTILSDIISSNNKQPINSTESLNKISNVDQSKLSIDSNPENKSMVNNTNISDLKKKIENEENKFIQSKSRKVLTHYSIVSIPTTLNIQINESNFLYKLKNQNFIQNMQDFIAYKNYKILILDHFENGTLREFLRVQNSLPLDKRVIKTEEDKIKLFSKIVQAVNNLNQLGYVHTNLSPDTIFIDDNFNPVIGGFDYIQEFQSISFINPNFFKNIVQLSIDENDSSKTITVSRNFGFIAPELILAKTEKMVIFSSKIDSYSLGAIYFYMLFNKNPFMGQTDKEVLNSLKDRYIFVQAGTSNNSIRILIKTLSLDPSIRLTTFQLEFNIQHEIKFGLEFKIKDDVEISTDILYTSRYGRTFFDKYSELIFVLIMAFFIIPITVYLASYRFKQDQANILNQNNNNNQNNDLPNPNSQNENNNIPLNQPNLQVTLANRLD